MERKLLFSNNLKEKLETVSFNTNSIWKSISIEDANSLMQKMVDCLNENYIKLNIKSFEFKDELNVYNESSTYFGIIENENEIIEGYVFVIPPEYATRSGVLAQQVFPVLSGIMPNYRNSKDMRISNRPIYVVNANEVSQTPSMVINILSGKILGFNYVDLFSRELEEILREKNLKTEVNSIEEYNEWLININNDKQNDFFELDKENKIIRFLIVRLKDGIRVNNEPYWFALKAYAAIYLAVKDGYRCDMSIFNQLARGNKTLDAFRDYAERYTKED